MFTPASSVSRSPACFGSAAKPSSGFSVGVTSTAGGSLFGAQPTATGSSSAFGAPVASGGLFNSSSGTVTGCGATATGGFNSNVVASPFGVAPKPSPASSFEQASGVAFDAPARPAFPPQRPCANPFRGGLSTRECFSANEDKCFGRRETTKPAFSWSNSAAAALSEPLFGFGSTGNTIASPFGSVQTSKPVTGWYFGGTTPKPQPPAQPTSAATWSGHGNPSHWSDATHPPYAPTVERDPISGQIDRVVSISSMPTYSHKSVEEMRLEHGNKPLAQGTAAASVCPASPWTTKKDTAWTGFIAKPPTTVFGPAAKTDGKEADTPSNPFARFQPPPTLVGSVENPFAPKPAMHAPGGHFHLDPVPQNPKPTWPLAVSEVKTNDFHFHLDPVPQNPKPTWPLVSANAKPATDWTSFRFGQTETATGSPSFSLFTPPPPQIEAGDPKAEAKALEQPVVVPDENFPYGSGDFGAGLVEQTVKAVLSTTTAKPDSNDPLALPVMNLQRSVSRTMGGSRASAFVRRSVANNSKALLAHGIRHTVAASRKPTTTSPPAKKLVERIVVGRRDGEPWKRSGLHLKTSLFAKTLGSAAVALKAAQDEQHDAAVEHEEGNEEPPATAAGDDGLDNYDL